jgi:hypothetical protein
MNSNSAIMPKVSQGGKILKSRGGLVLPKTYTNFFSQLYWQILCKVTFWNIYVFMVYKLLCLCVCVCVHASFSALLVSPLFYTQIY